MDEQTNENLPKCPSCRNARRKEFPPSRKGTYSTRDGEVRQRWLCGNPSCGRTFSEPRKSADLGRRKDIDAMLFKLACSGVSIRRSAVLLDAAVNTVRKRMEVIAEKARAAHVAAASDPARHTSSVQFDEMQTFLSSKAKPLSIALVVRRHNGDILSAKVATASAKGRLAAKGRAMGWVGMNQAASARREALLEASKFLRSDRPPLFVCDGLRAYPPLIRQVIGPHALVESNARDEGDPHDPLFRLNHVCAKIRSDLACMARDTWTTTKKVKCLQDRLDIYIAWNNGYNM